MPFQDPKTHRTWILYVEDDPQAACPVADFFIQRGLDVILAFSSPLAQQILNLLTPSLIFLDLHMPHINGKEFLHYLKDKNLKIPVIVITGFPEEIAELEEEAFEIKGFFTKPVKLEDLFQETKKILNL